VFSSHPLLWHLLLTLTLLLLLLSHLQFSRLGLCCYSGCCCCCCVTCNPPGWSSYATAAAAVSPAVFQAGALTLQLLLLLLCHLQSSRLGLLLLLR
jgi:hypothetical protein